MKQMLCGLLACLLMVSSAPAQKFENLAQTPPMGWNSWNKFACDVSEELIKQVADAMVETGMKDAGYEYVVIDDCWQVDRDSEGNIVVDPERFPSGMKALADYVHSKGLKFGLYSDAGTATCQGRPGSRGYEFRDARTYAAWGVDYLKYDWCNTGTQDAEASYTLMRDALYEAGRPIVFSICEWGDNEPWLWAEDVGHLWRTTGDIQDCWSCVYNWGGLGVMQILDKQVPLRQYTGPGHWNDPDMLEVGNGGLTESENRAHFSMWCMLSAPLMTGNDIRDMSDTVAEILTNKEVIALDQDKSGIPALKWVDYGEREVWVKPLEGGEFAYCFLNRGETDWTLEYPLQRSWIPDPDFGWKNYSITGDLKVRDLWTHKDLGTSDTPYSGVVPPHDVVLLRLSKE
ncbi:MAG: glycoside hydrolase family 27 protein [candidate division KSB1 bacterium]|nr:glycoside hydrolase family 27 protein [candidate division KSB1 bacterium]